MLDLPILNEARSIKAQTPIIRLSVTATGSQQIEIIDRHEAETMATETKRLRDKTNKELNSFEKIIKKTEKLTGSKIYKKYGLDEDLLRARIAEAKTNLSLAKKKYKTGEFTEAQEIIFIMKSINLEDIFNVYNDVRKGKEKIKIIKNAEVKETIYNLLEEVISVANEGDFSKADLALEEMNKELFRLADKYIKNNSSLSIEMKEKFDGLEVKIIEKLQTN